MYALVVSRSETNVSRSNSTSTASSPQEFPLPDVTMPVIAATEKVPLEER